MRVNVYTQELTSDCELVRKEGTNLRGENEVFYGIRLYLKSPSELHSTEIDDDRSAITFWLPRPNEPMAKEFVEVIGDMAEMVTDHYNSLTGMQTLGQYGK